jgi:long-subunit acyl-CoA synthetase (AMP-forming)
METASEGGAWGIALLAAYMDQKNGKTLSEYLADVIFKNAKCEKTAPDEEDVKGFDVDTSTLDEKSYDDNAIALIIYTSGTTGSP